MYKNTGSEQFARMLFEVGVERGLQGMYDLMENPPHQEKETWAKVKEWYGNQSEESKQIVRFMAKEAIIFAVFELEVNFDGAAGNRVWGEHQVDFAVNMRVYESEEAVENETPDTTIAVCPTTRGEDVHDIFLDLVDESNRADRSDQETLP